MKTLLKVWRSLLGLREDRVKGGRPRLELPQAAGKVHISCFWRSNLRGFVPKRHHFTVEDGKGEVTDNSHEESYLSILEEVQRTCHYDAPQRIHDADE